jgi:hybrid polyketide synthase / nonribosomal peptide synthetase ACE1
MLEEFREHGVLDWFYKEAIGTSEYNTYLGGVLKQLSFRYPHMNILEIGIASRRHWRME